MFFTNFAGKDRAKLNSILSCEKRFSKEIKCTLGDKTWKRLFYAKMYLWRSIS